MGLFSGPDPIPDPRVSVSLSRLEAVLTQRLIRVVQLRVIFLDSAGHALQVAFLPCMRDWAFLRAPPAPQFPR